MDEPLCPCLVVIPLDYNPARAGVPPREVEPETMVEILSWFDRQFGGYTPVSQAGVGGLPPGCWEGQPDRSLTLKVALPQHRTPEFLQVVRAIGVRLKQRAMYYEIGPPSAYIMPIDEAGRAEVAEGGN